MVLMAGFELPVRAIRHYVSSALDLIVQIERLDDGTRHVTLITEVQRMEGDVITLHNLFEYRMEGMSEDRKVMGHLRPTGLRPTFGSKFERHGLEMPDALFGTPDTAVFGAQGDPDPRFNDGDYWAQRGTYK
jgi:pilus assembly protein CpaF